MPTMMLFIFYFVVLLFCLAAIIKRKKIDLSFRIVTLIYAYKVLLGCVYGYIFLKYYHGDDTWMLHKESLLQYQKLMHQPLDFIKDFLPDSAFRASNNFWQGMQFYNMDLEFYSTTKLLALFNIFSRGNYYINVLFFDFIAIFGPVLLYKLLSAHFFQRKKAFICVLFFLPPTTFWLSGIRAEALLLLSISVLLYYSNKWFNARKKIAYLLYIVSAITGSLILRGQMLLVFIPAFFSMTLSWRKPKKALFYFNAVYIACIILFVASLYIAPENNLSTPIIKRQQEFFKLHGNTAFQLNSLQPSAISFIKVFHQAFTNTFLRPFIWEAKGLLQIFTALDIIFFWTLLFGVFIFHEKNWKILLMNPLILLFIFYSISQTIFIGYIVPFPGAIVRYKSIPEYFLFTSIIVVFDLKRLKDSIKNMYHSL